MQNTEENRSSLRSLFPVAAKLCCICTIALAAPAEARQKHTAHHHRQHYTRIIKRVPPPIGTIKKGVASFYHARPDKDAPNGNLTMAHRTWPKDITRVRVTNEKTGLATCVLVTDSGPYIAGRIADLSKPAAEKIGLTTKQGLTHVTLEVVASCSPLKRKYPNFLHFGPY